MYLAVAHYANMREGTIAGTPEELEAARQAAVAEAGVKAARKAVK